MIWVLAAFYYTLENEAGFPQKQRDFLSNEITEKYLSDQWLEDQKELHPFRIIGSRVQEMRNF